jgi:hypothetical protein
MAVLVKHISNQYKYFCKYFHWLKQAVNGCTYKYV